MSKKKLFFIASEEEWQLKDLQGVPLWTCFSQFFDRIVIKKTANLNQVSLLILERFASKTNLTTSGILKK